MHLRFSGALAMVSLMLPSIQAAGIACAPQHGMEQHVSSQSDQAAASTSMNMDAMDAQMAVAQRPSPSDAGGDGENDPCDGQQAPGSCTTMTACHAIVALNTERFDSSMIRMAGLRFAEPVPLQDGVRLAPQPPPPRV